jgi:hypothetical protein
VYADQSVQVVALMIFKVQTHSQYYRVVSTSILFQRTTAACMIIVHLQGFEQIFDLEKRTNFYHVMLQTLLGKTFHIWLEILMMFLSGCIYVHVQDMLSLSLYQAITSLCCKRNGMKGGGSSTTTSTNLELGLFHIGKVLALNWCW